MRYDRQPFLLEHFCTAIANFPQCFLTASILHQFLDTIQTYQMVVGRTLQIKHQQLSRRIGV